MKVLRVQIKNSASEASETTLVALQNAFSMACNFVSDVALRHDCFSRVRLHHLAYKPTREKFPELGSQLVSNAIYAVSRRAKGLSAPPVSEDLRFEEFSPVFFDRHTLSVKQSSLSMLTLDGRMKFQVALSAEFLRLFKEGPLKEVQLVREDDQFFLMFCFKEATSQQAIVQKLEQPA